MTVMEPIILGIESSCDDTSAAVIRGRVMLSNVIASQQVHKDYGGVVPELASRAHELNIVPVVSEALSKAGVKASDLSAVAFPRGPGLLGSLLVGTSFAKAFSLALDVPLVEVNHLQGHVLASFIQEEGAPVREPSFPYLCLLVSGGNSQIVRVNGPLSFDILGQTIDDAVGEAFDKCSKMLGLGYPGGPVIDKLASQGDPSRFTFAKPHIPGLDYSFSGVKTSLLMDKLVKAAKQTGIRQIAIGGGVSANSGLRARILSEGARRGWQTWLPPLRFTTDNAAMIAVAGYFHFLAGERAPLDLAPLSRC